jgi:hypothetical protein
MTSPRLRQAAVRRLRVPAIVTACAVPVLAACSGVAAQVELPPKPSTATPVTRSEPGSATPRQQVLAALTGYTAALGRAEQSRSDTLARRLLRPYLAASRVGGLVEAIAIIWARGDSFYGEDVLHVLSVRIDGRRAFVHDCDDTSAMGLEDTATGQAVPGSAGVQHANLVTRLGHVAGRWLVESQVLQDVPCAS